MTFPEMILAGFLLVASLLMLVLFVLLCGYAYVALREDWRRVLGKNKET